MPKGGARPGAGRKSLDAEFKRFESITRCFDVVMEFVNSDAPLKERAEMAAKLAIRSVPDRLEHSGPDGSALRIVQLVAPNAQDKIDTEAVQSDTVSNG